MSERRWTCPESGWYHAEIGRDPVFLGTELPGRSTARIRDDRPSPTRADQLKGEGARMFMLVWVP